MTTTNTMITSMKTHHGMSAPYSDWMVLENATPIDVPVIAVCSGAYRKYSHATMNPARGCTPRLT